MTLGSCQVWRRLVTIVPGTLEAPGPYPDVMAAPAYPPRPERQEWDGMGNNGTGIKISAGDTPEGHQFSFESASGMGKMGKKWDRMGQIQSHFSRASFPLTLGQVPAPDLSGQMRLPCSRLDARPVPGIQSLRPPVIGAVMFVGV